MSLPSPHLTEQPALFPSQSRNHRFPAARAISALILREMATRYGNSPGGYIWAILDPLGAIIMLSFGFSLLLRSPALGSSFLLFFTAAYLPLHMYQATSGVVSSAINFSRPLLKFPSVSWIDALLARYILNTLTVLLVSYLILTGVLISLDTRTSLEFGPIVRAMGLATILGFGIGSLNCVLAGLFPVWGHIWGILTRPLFIASGIFYIYENLSQTAQGILWYNPLIHLTGLMRSGVYSTYNPTYINELYVLGFGLITSLLGLILMRRYHRDILNQ
jgi:capsular polysaccharide transport system permease protein